MVESPSFPLKCLCERDARRGESSCAPFGAFTHDRNRTEGQAALTAEGGCPAVRLSEGLENRDMRGKIAAVALLLVLGLLAGCNTLGRRPSLYDAAMKPAELKPGETAVVTVHVADKHEIVSRVEGVVREDPRIKLKLRDDGQSPDQKAGDKIWSLQVDVPFQAPPGTFNLDLTAYRSDGTPVPVRQKGKVVPLVVTVPITIGAQ
jgi:hypothetical protein